MLSCFASFFKGGCRRLSGRFGVVLLSYRIINRNWKFLRGAPLYAKNYRL